MMKFASIQNQATSGRDTLPTIFFQSMSSISKIYHLETSLLINKPAQKQ